MANAGQGAATHDQSALESFVDCQPSLAGMLEDFGRAAKSNAPILIRGESGTGRSTLARALHGASGRKTLVESDVGLIPATLFEGELFGYKRGAFTGADTSRRGLVSRAESGTLLLDRIEEMPLQLQPKLLRLLSENRFAPLGGHEQNANVRFISIAGTDLGERIQHGTFREDLFYRLEVLTFALPALRERSQDLPTLLDTLVEDAKVRYGKAELELEAKTRAWMEFHDWPGNLREMRNVLERALVLHEKGPLTIPQPKSRRDEKPLPLADLEAEAVIRALRYTRGHQGKAAEVLGISRKTLWEKRKRYDIP